MDGGVTFGLLDLHLPQEIVPATLKKTARPAAPRRACKIIIFLIYKEFAKCTNIHP